MQIVSVKAMPATLAVRRDFKWAGLKVDLGGFTLVEIRADDGTVGYGECTPLPDWGGDFGRRGGETVSGTTQMIREVLAPCLIGMDPTAPVPARLAMDAALIGNSYAKCAIDIALHDLWGKATGQPVYKLLGGACRPSVAVAHMVGLMDEDAALAEAVAAVADGLTALQIKGGVDAARDIRLIGAIRRAVGPGVMLRLDANQGFRDAKTGRRRVRGLIEAGVDCVEQPVAGLAAMAEVTRGSDCPIIADESCWDIADALEVVRLRAADCISIYLAKAGGFVGARKLADIAQAASLPCDVNGSIESGIGNAANLHFALASPAVSLPSVIPISAPAGRHPNTVGGNYYLDDGRRAAAARFAGPRDRAAA
jgi:muconate cycloisomerase